MTIIATLRRHVLLFFFNDTATTEIYTLSLHERSSDLPVGDAAGVALEVQHGRPPGLRRRVPCGERDAVRHRQAQDLDARKDRKSTRLNSSHANISYAVFCLKKKKIYE